MIPQHDDFVSEEGRLLLKEIRRVFGEVQRGSGVTLHETIVIDQYGSDNERKQARRKDTDRHWWEVRDEWIETICGVGGLSFLDNAGFRYYLPAYMSYWIRTGEEPYGLEFHLQRHSHWDFDKIFSLAEKKVIAKFLNYIRYRFKEDIPGATLDSFWKRYFDPSDEL